MVTNGVIGLTVRPGAASESCRIVIQDSNVWSSGISSGSAMSRTTPAFTAVSDLHRQIRYGEIYGLLGANGAGKTTTIKLLLGLARPTDGTARIFGLDIGKNSVAIRQRIGYLAQDPRYYEHMTARETLRFTARFFFSGPKAAIEERIQETMWEPRYATMRYMKSFHK